jgi:hypothetical protein
MAQALTVPLAPSFDPFGLFGMTAVADLESLMGCRIIDTVRGEAGGYGIGGQGSGCGALGRRNDGGLEEPFIYTQRA